MLSNKPWAPAKSATAPPLPPSAAAPAAAAPLAPLPFPAAPAASPSQPLRRLAQEGGSILRPLAFWFGLAFVFARVSFLSEVIAISLGFNSRLLYLLGPPAILGALMGGALQRTLRAKLSFWFLAFYIWVLIAAPFSSWPGWSVMKAIEYGKNNFVMLFIVGGLAVSWQDIRRLFYTLAAAGLVNLAAARALAQESQGRISLDTASSSIGNANDLATHILLVLPFLIYIILDSRRTIFLRLALLLGVAFGCWTILGTASRGALIGVAAAALVLLWHATFSQKAAAVLAALVLFFGIWVTLPSLTRERLGSLFGLAEHQEAKESQLSRIYLLRKSIEFSIRHPLFGVGSDQFATFEGYDSRKQGMQGNWHTAHNMYTQLSAECGIPALVFMLGCLVLSARGVIRLFQAARRAGLRDLSTACRCYLMAFAGYFVSVLFLSHAYTFYIPLMVGVAASLTRVGKKELEAAAAPGPAAAAQNPAAGFPAAVRLF